MSRDVHSENGKNRREELRSKVEMPDQLEETELLVGGTRAYRRNALMMVFAGLFMIIATVLLLIFTDHFFFVLPFVGLYVAGLGVKKLTESTSPEVEEVEETTKEPNDEKKMIIARLNCRILPLDRARLFRIPLDNLLMEQGYGEVDGSGSQLSAQYEVAYCCLDIVVNQINDEIIQFIKTRLEDLGSPKGSLLMVNYLELPFGRNEGLALYLKDHDLPSKPQDYEANHLFREIQQLVNGVGSIYGCWNGREESALYLYGPSFEAMKERLANYVQTLPLSQKARLEQIA